MAPWVYFHYLLNLRFIKAIINYPCLILTIIFLIASTCGFIGVWFGKVPEFSNPLKVGFDRAEERKHVNFQLIITKPNFH